MREFRSMRSRAIQQAKAAALYNTEWIKQQVKLETSEQDFSQLLEELLEKEQLTKERVRDIKSEYNIFKLQAQMEATKQEAQREREKLEQKTKEEETAKKKQKDDKKQRKE